MRYECHLLSFRSAAPTTEKLRPASFFGRLTYIRSHRTRDFNSVIRGIRFDEKVILRVSETNYAHRLVRFRSADILQHRRCRTFEKRTDRRPADNPCPEPSGLRCASGRRREGKDDRYREVYRAT